MCLFQRKLKNPRYTITEKNRGHIPDCTDKRQEYIFINCGYCIECLKQKAAQWKVRLYEEFKATRKSYFVTFTFDASSLHQLTDGVYKTGYRGYQGETMDVNILSSFAVRRWSERWRKKHKKAPRHWLITELGHKNSERIHLHGLIFIDNLSDEQARKDITDTWKYGNVYIGKFVDYRTINYITKYITKPDTINKEYRPKMFVSKGLGKSYIENNKQIHLFSNETTNTKYQTYNGYKIELPRYYKMKLYTEEERQILWSHALDKNECFIKGVKYNLDEQDDLQRRTEFINALQKAREVNTKCNYGNMKTMSKSFIITDKMLMTNAELKYHRLHQYVKSIKKREIYKEVTSDATSIHQDNLNKSMLNEYYINSYYTGNTTKAQREYNKLLEEAISLKISVKNLRLVKKNIIDLHRLKN